MEKYQAKAINDFFVSTFNNVLICEERALADAGDGDLSVRELHLLSAVIQLEQEKKNSMGNIAALMNITLGALTTAVNTLVRKGYLQRKHHEQDRRVVLVCATEKGKAANDRHSAFHRAMIDHIAELIPEPEDMEKITAMLERLSSFFAGWQINKQELNK